MVFCMEYFVVFESLSEKSEGAIKIFKFEQNPRVWSHGAKFEDSIELTQQGIPTIGKHIFGCVQSKNWLEPLLGLC